MYVFYNLAGIIIGILSILMLSISSITEEGGQQFNTAKRCLSVMFLLTSISMFVAQFESKLAHDTFEKLNPLMLLFFFLIGQGVAFSILTLYDSPYAGNKFVKRALYPVLSLFGIYSVLYGFMGDVQIYSAKEFFSRLPHEYMLMLRCVILVAMTISIIYTITLCHKAKHEYYRLIQNYFSETDFARSIWLSKLLGCVEALSIWVVMTYFYTTLVLEMLVGTLIIVVFAFYVKEFHEYSRRYETLRPAILLSQEGYICIEKEEVKSPIETETEIIESEVAKRLNSWITRKDKPFTRSKLTIDDVAREICIPKYKVSQYVNECDINFCSWINRLRIEEAAILLKERKDLSISEIGENTGFCDLPAFSRAFKKIKGVSPRDFRNQFYSVSL